MDGISLLGWHYKGNGWGESSKRSWCVLQLEEQRLEKESKMAADAWSGGLLDCLDDHFHVVCPVCVPPGRGDCFVYFCVLFRLLNVE